MPPLSEAIDLDVSFGKGFHEETLLKGPDWPDTPTLGDVGTSLLSNRRHTQPRRPIQSFIWTELFGRPMRPGHPPGRLATR